MRATTLTVGNGEMVPVEPLRRHYEASGLGPAEVARRLGWLCKKKHGRYDGADTSRLERALGIRDQTTRGYRSRSRYVRFDLALRLAEAMGMDPALLGVDLSKPREFDLLDLAARYEAGETLKSICADVRVGRTSLTARLREVGVVIRKPGERYQGPDPEPLGSRNGHAPPYTVSWRRGGAVSECHLRMDRDLDAALCGEPVPRGAALLLDGGLEASRHRGACQHCFASAAALAEAEHEAWEEMGGYLPSVILRRTRANGGAE